MDDFIFPVFASFVGSATVGSLTGFDNFFIFEINQRVMIFLADQDNTAAVTAVTAVGSTSRNLFFPSETNTAISTLTGCEGNNCAIDKHYIE